MVFLTITVATMLAVSSCMMCTRYLDNIRFSLEETKVLAKAARPEAAKEAARPDPTVIAGHGTPGS